MGLRSQLERAERAQNGIDRPKIIGHFVTCNQVTQLEGLLESIDKLWPSALSKD